MSESALKKAMSIRPEMTVLDMVSKYRQTEAVLKKYEKQAGECIFCQVLFDTLQDVVKKYDFSLEKFIANIEAVISQS